jgi:putative ABC transport system permease protein
MFRNYLTIGLRILRRNPIYSLINVVGLSIGIASCLLILLFVQSEWSFDAFHENSDRIYRVARIEHRLANPTKISESTAAPLADAVRSSVPGVEKATRYLNSQVNLVVANAQTQITVAYADPDFFDIFDFSRDGSTLLESPENILVTESANKEYFGGSLQAGSTVEIENNLGAKQFSVGRIIPDPPVTSSIQFQFVTNFTSSAFFSQRADSWTSFSPSLFLLLSDKANLDAIETGLAAIVETNLGDQIRSSIESGWLEDRSDAFSLFVQPLSDVHLSPEVDSFNVTVSDPRYSLILLAIALGILLIACVNFISQSIGRADTRQREVAMRKSLGADKSQLVQQFLGESLLITVLAAVFGLVLADLLIPTFNQLANQNLSDASLASPTMLAIFCGLILLCSILAGLYPSLYLAKGSQTEPGSRLLGAGENRIVRTVVVGQFAVAIGLVAAVLIIHGQMRFIDTQDLGFEKEQLVVVDMNSGRAQADDVADLFQQSARTSPNIVAVSGTSSSFGDNWSRMVVVEGETNHITYTMRVDPEFLETTGISIVAGRNLSAEFGQDAESSIVVNEAFVRAFGYENPIGTMVAGLDSATVVGVVEDFKFLSLREEVPPTILHMSPELASENYTLVRFQASNLLDSMTDLENAWASVAPDNPFVAQFLDDRLYELYVNERRWQRIVTLAASLALFLSCLGLRKVLGSSITQIVLLLSKDFAKIVVVAFVVSVPICWMLMERWLSTFAYRTSISAWVFVCAGLATLIVALLTVAHRSMVAAMMNPVESLRGE